MLEGYTIGKLLQIAPHNRATSLLHSRRRAQVLVVGVNETVLKSISASFYHQGYDVVFVSAGHPILLAPELLDDIALCVLDIALSGLFVCKLALMAARRSPTIPVLLLDTKYDTCLACQHNCGITRVEVRDEAGNSTVIIRPPRWKC